jgi:2-keto-4-pentenoate hydratase
MPDRLRVPSVIAAALIALPFNAAGACLDQETADAMAQAFVQKTSGPSLPAETSLEQAYCAQRMFLATLRDDLGAPVGYKAGLTNRQLQERFGAREPLGGMMFAPMLLPSGTALDANYGVRPVYEADLIVTVTDERINEASTPEEALQSLGEVVPFIELLDLVPGEPKSLNLATIAAYNIVSRHGVTGKGIPVQATTEFIEALANMESVTTDDTGRVVQVAKGSDILGNPVNVVLWLIRHVHAQGGRLRAGDVLSLGAMGKFHPTEPGRTVKVLYTGLPGGDSEVTVTFR